MELKVNCPFCARRGHKPDRTKNLGINPAKNMAHCFRCGYGTRDARSMVLHEQLPIDVSAFGMGALDDRPRETVRLPPEYTADFTHTRYGEQVLAYLLQRGLSRAVIAAYELGHCETGTYRGRIVIPVYEYGLLVSFQARDWRDRSEVKYLSPASGEKGVLFNLERPARAGVLLLTEGPFDALRMPEFAVAVLGKEWTAEKRDRVLAARPAAVVLALDNDSPGRMATEAIENDLLGLVPHVLRLPYTAKDLGSASDQELRSAYWLCRTLADAAGSGAAAAGRAAV